MADQSNTLSSSSASSGSHCEGEGNFGRDLAGSVKGTDLFKLAMAADFAAKKHINQRRKVGDHPYVNHPIGVAALTLGLAGCNDVEVAQAALLHDTLEDTNTTYDELVQHFGKRVADIVLEVTDDETLGRGDRKRAQITKIAAASAEAKIVKLCDRLYNLRDLVSAPPPGYTRQRIQGYCVLSKMLVEAAKGACPPVEEALRTEIFEGHFAFEGQTYPCCPERIDEDHIFPK